MRALSAPGLQASVSDLEFAHTVLLVGVEPVDDAAILDLRIRKGVRRNGVKLAIASARPSTLDSNAALTARYAPGDDGAFLAELEAALAGTRPETPAGELAGLLRDGGEDVVIVYSRADRRRRRPLAAADRPALGLEGRDGAGLLEIPSGANGRGLREAGVLPDAGPGFAPLAGDATGRDAAGIARAAADGELTALYLLGTDPTRDQPDRALWERALNSAALVVAHASVMTEGLREHATVIFPLESHAEKEGTVVHPDGRLQRQRSRSSVPARSGPAGRSWPRSSVAPEATSTCSAPPTRSLSWCGGAVLRRHHAGGDRRRRPALARGRGRRALPVRRRRREPRRDACEQPRPP